MMGDQQVDMWTAASRSRHYGVLARMFHDPSFGSTETELELRVPPPSSDYAVAFVEAFDPAVSSTACSLWEGTYASQDRSGLFEELARYYEHFGLARSLSAELPDHIGVELEFMHFLAYLEHEKQQCGDDVSDLHLAQKDFLSRHLLRLACGIQSNCRSTEPRIGAMTNQLLAFVSEDYERLRGMSEHETETCT